MRFNNDFIGHDNPEYRGVWVGSDSKAIYDEALKKMPNDWYYRDNKVYYTYNKNGHRCKEIDEVDLDNYILFTGCSHTESIGVEIEKSYPYLISKELNCDYYNLALAASGPDVLEYNLTMWFAKISKLPKFVIVQWPDATRFASKIESYSNLLPHGTWTDLDEVSRMIVLGSDIGYFNARKQLCLNTVKAVIRNTRLISLTFNNMELYDNYSIFIKQYDYARDLSHPGIKSHEIWAKEVLANL